MCLPALCVVQECPQDIPHTWMLEMTTHLRAVDRHHLILMGTEGKCSGGARWRTSRNTLLFCVRSRHRPECHPLHMCMQVSSILVLRTSTSSTLVQAPSVKVWPLCSADWQLWLSLCLCWRP